MEKNPSKRLDNIISYTKYLLCKCAYEENYARRIGFDESALRYMSEINMLMKVLSSVNIEVTFDIHIVYTSKVYFTDLTTGIQESHPIETEFEWLNRHE